MNLDVDNWKDFNVKDIFSKIEYGKNSYAIDLVDGHDCIYVGAKKDDNGFMKWCKRDDSLISKGNCIVFIVDGKGSVGYCNYMDRDFIATANLKLGYCKELNQYNGLFIATVVSQERFRYSFGRKWKKFVKDTVIKLPAIQNQDGSYSPDWQFMEDYIKSLHYKPLTTKNKPDNVPKLDVSEWKEFKVGNIFECSTTILSIKDDLEAGTIPLVSRTAENNGIDGYFEVEQNKIQTGNCITIGAEGVYAFYQPNNFATGNKVYTLRHEKLNPYIALFITTVLNQETYKYSYGRARILSKLQEETIKLPSISNSDGTYSPDWDYMENYIKSLPYGDRI